MPALWTCPRCRRLFRRKNQQHSCGTGSRQQMLAGKPAALVKLYDLLEKPLRQWPGVEIVYKPRYALFRTTRVFADLVFMRDALRLAVLLDRQVNDPMFFQSGKLSTHRVAHVAKLTTAGQVRAAAPYLKEAYRLAGGELKRSRQSV